MLSKSLGLSFQVMAGYLNKPRAENDEKMLTYKQANSNQFWMNTSLTRELRVHLST